VRQQRTEAKKRNRKEKKVLFLELIDTCHTRLQESGQADSDLVNTPNIATLIHERVKMLAEQQCLTEELASCEQDA
jgi:hypothetical protein